MYKPYILFAHICMCDDDASMDGASMDGASMDGARRLSFTSFASLSFSFTSRARRVW